MNDSMTAGFNYILYFGLGLIIILQSIILWVLYEMKKELRAIKLNNVCGQLSWLNIKLNRINESTEYIKRCVW